MKTSSVTVALVAVVSSLVTVGAIELLRGSRSSTRLAESSDAPLARGGEPLVPATHAADPGAAGDDRLDELERRIAALELGSAAHREPVISTERESALPARDELRDLVLDWVAQEREARGRTEALEGEEALRTELGFKARHQALLLAQEHDLVPWQEKKLTELFLEIETRNYEVGKDMNPLTADPEEFERRWAEFDEWADQRYLEILGPELVEQLFGDE